MFPHRETLLCRYHYDPLDRLVDCTPSAQVPTRRFYLKDRLATEIQDAVQRSIMQHDDQLLAQQQRQSGTQETRLLATDQQRSMLAILDATRPHHLAYTPYGHRIPENGLLSLLGFNGEQPDPVTGHYLLGNGYRAFNPVLMRFNSPDSWSPFGKGGLNGYAYCVGDPVNIEDPSGHMPFKFSKSFKSSSRPNSTSRPNVSPPTNTTSQPTPSLATASTSRNASTSQAAPTDRHDARTENTNDLSSNHRINQANLRNNLQPAQITSLPPDMTYIIGFGSNNGPLKYFQIPQKQLDLYRRAQDQEMSRHALSDLIRKGSNLPEGYTYVTFR
ncbi:RHS repeat-associated core domain-containing protein [Pseudomonas sp. Irchel s3h17]|uniref:RHS repeat-associated core domain-containing protein n=1 Tax=Pseudomonas sp. Irchel s3h17 TaxID=2009182 RepID=UPI002115391C|nr:RHS repeat-associated core domain-containing protein [Pseudomonas sp. Irchel s3h17]